LKILFFAPHSGVWIHAFPEALVAEALQQDGHEITYVGCGGLLNSHCVSMSAASVPFEASHARKDRVCRLCKKNGEIIRTRFGFAGPDLMTLVTAEDLSFADELIGSVAPRSHPDLVVDQVEVGKIALYEMLIQTKTGELNFGPDEQRRYQASLKNVIVVLRLAQRIIGDQKPDRIILYNALYSINRTVCRLAELLGIPQYYLHAGDNLSKRLQTLVLARNHAFFHYQYLRSRWPDFENRPCSSNVMAEATNHLLEMARGRSIWAYSAAPRGFADLRQVFQIADGQRVICATMSSDDERFGGEIAGVLPNPGNLLFPKQVDWVRALIEYVNDRRDLCLVIRVHPREFPNKRERVLSDHARMLKEAFVKLPGNVKVNWPTDAISLYDLAGITDVFANAWSSAGREMSWLGLPVVLYSPELTLYPPSLNYVGTTTRDYFDQIERALSDGWNVERIRKTYRWCAVDLIFAALDISESFSASEHRSFFEKIIDTSIRSIAPTHEQRRNSRLRAARLSAAGRIDRIVSEELNGAIDLRDFNAATSHEEETQFLKREVRRIVEGLYGMQGGFEKHSLPGKLLGFANS
jgi:hypothetical protein